jgi:hypothetical protein
MSNEGENLLATVEAILLPKTVPDEFSANEKKEFSNTPNQRFREMVFELAVADHVRSVQTIYRDSFDEQHLYQELRGTNTQLPTKQLMEKIIEGRVRVCALAKLCYRPDNPAVFRGKLDLGAAYAHHGMWSQSYETVTELLHVLEKPSSHSPQQMNEQLALSMECANRVLKVYKCLRKHVQANAGKIFPSVIKEIVAALENEMNNTTFNETLPHPSKLAASFHSFFQSTVKKTAMSGNASQSSVRKKFSLSYFQEQHEMNHNNNNKNSPGSPTTNKDNDKDQDANNNYRSWGDLIDFCRNSCEIMKVWFDNAEAIFFPQNKATLMVPFRHCDPSQRNLAHCMQLSNEIGKFPATLKLISGSNFLKALAEMNLAIPIDNQLLFSNRPQSANLPPNKSILYELPLTFEEYLCLYLLECPNYVSQQFELMKIQTTTFQGICHCYLDRLSEAETIFIKSLHLLETLNLDMELCSCELFNSIAQMMIVKYTHWLNHKKSALKQEIEQWMDNTEDGKKLVRVQIRNIKKQFNFQHPVLPLAELQFQAKEIIFKAKFKEFFASTEENHENNEMKKILEGASRYLIRSYEILEGYHQNNQAIVGTSCLAIASVQNLLKDYEECREWLLRALRIFEKSSPLPARAISFTQIQLANVLKKLSHEEEARRVLIKALEFHRSQARIGLMSKAYTSPLTDKQQQLHPLVGEQNDPNNSNNYNEKLLFPVILKNSSLFEEIDLSSKLLKEVIDLSMKCGDRWEASLYAEDLAKLVESAFGWDSTEAAETYKEVGHTCGVIENWTKALHFYQLSLQSFVSIFDNSHPKCVQLQKLMETTKEKIESGAGGGGGAKKES